MPNYVENKLKIIGNQERIQDVLNYLKSDYGCIDFNKITPMPDWVFNKNLGRETEEKYGKENCWYEWCNTNWGTKWNAFGLDDRGVKDNVIRFRTAWDGVSDLIRKLSIIFKDIELEYSYCDYDDYGQNIHQYIFKDYEIVKHINCDIDCGNEFNSDLAKELFKYITETELLAKCTKCGTIIIENINVDESNCLCYDCKEEEDC